MFPCLHLTVERILSAAFDLPYLFPPLQIQGQQLFQYLFIGQIGFPAIGGKDGFGALPLADEILRGNWHLVCPFA